MRPSGRQGARADEPVRPDARLGAARGGRPRRPTVLVARTDALSATLLTSDVDERDREFTTGERTPEGFFRIAPGIEAPIARALAYAPYADVLWCETSTPDLEEAAQFAEAVHAKFPGKLSRTTARRPSTGAPRRRDDRVVPARAGRDGLQVPVRDPRRLPRVCNSMFESACGYAADGMSSYVQLQQAEFANEEFGYTATRHQREVGAGYFDAVLEAVTGGESSTLALKGSTEEAQFEAAPAS